ncbi:MAG: type II toxin-antitoxin system RelE/ParE family toxin [Gammaproteobacteria bacterium]|nr:type II toxin-antitoxin system RelE/ParE family toxin [Gammaproteobacteria bacterium]
MRYRIEITRRAHRELERLPTRVRERVAEHIGLLGANPRDPGLNIKRLTNDPDARLRLRVGSYRVKYNRDDRARVIRIIRIGHRREVY